MLTQFGGEGARHPGHGVLAGGVVHHERLHLQSGRRADQNDRPAAAAVDDLLRAGHHGVPGSGHVDVHHVAKRFGRDLVPRLRSRDAGVGDDDVEPPEGGDGVVHGLTQAVEITNVDCRGDDSTAGGLDEPDGFGEVFRSRRVIGHADGSLPAMSTAMMSAPSRAIRTACARPWPRAAPVMNATLPVSRPVMCAPYRKGHCNGTIGTSAHLPGHCLRWAALTRFEPMISRWISLVPS